MLGRSFVNSNSTNNSENTTELIAETKVVKIGFLSSTVN
ncbi:hypothetical protein CCAN11_1840012 [Capnocytophaga canimorsus]|uniref:Uncharacterized protein n=1 Tax=Capnocytophaga canimorsus TaxID=28188 RepID=A0A0B7IG46_9FLAO|nr:hypothetical protein CCAN11_1840012 [Capnocytophaga canimorsus]